MILAIAVVVVDCHGIKRPYAIVIHQVAKPDASDGVSMSIKARAMGKQRNLYTTWEKEEGNQVTITTRHHEAMMQVEPHIQYNT